jgi:hypothetical protein
MMQSLLADAQSALSVGAAARDDVALLLRRRSRGEHWCAQTEAEALHELVCRDLLASSLFGER